MNDQLNNENNNGLWKTLIVLSFIMLSAMTWANSPIQKIIEKTQKKQTLIAKFKVCEEMMASEDVYKSYTKNIFVSGCLTNMRDFLVILNPDKEEHFKNVFQQQSSEEFDSWLNACTGSANDYEQQGKITAIIIREAYYETLKCDKVVEEAQAMGITKKDINEQN